MKKYTRVLLNLSSASALVVLSFNSFASTNSIDNRIGSHPSFLAPLPEVSQQTRQAIIDYSQQLAIDPNSPTVGRVDAPVTVVEFFDYQCMYCHKAFPAFEAYVKEHPNIRFVFKEFPIGGAISQYAALTSLEAYHQGGASLFMKYHNAQFTATNSEGKQYIGMLKSNKLTTERVDEIASAAGVKIAKKAEMDKYQQEIDNNFQLARQISVTGTPTFVVLPTPRLGKKITAHQVSLIPGAVPIAYINQAVNIAKK